MHIKGNYIITALALLAAGLVAWYFSAIVTYLVISLVITFILKPLVNIIGDLRIKDIVMPRWLATVISMSAFIAVALALFSFFFPLVLDQIYLLSEIDYAQLGKSLEQPLTWTYDLVRKYGIADNPEEELLSIVEEKARNMLSFGQLTSMFNDLLSIAGDLAIGIFAVTFITFFFLKEENLSTSLVLALFPEHQAPKARKVMLSIRLMLSRYFIGLLIQITLIFTLVSTSLGILGVRNALLIGAFAGIINVIPYLGPIFGASFGLFVALTTHADYDFVSQMLPLLLKVVVVFLVVQSLDNIVFQPLIFSNSVRAHPLEIFLLIFAAGKLGGIIGMVVAIPVYTILRVFAKEFLIQFRLVRQLTQKL